MRFRGLRGEITSQTYRCKPRRSVGGTVDHTIFCSYISRASTTKRREEEALDT